MSSATLTSHGQYRDHLPQSPRPLPISPSTTATTSLPLLSTGPPFPPPPRMSSNPRGQNTTSPEIPRTSENMSRSASGNESQSRRRAPTKDGSAQSGSSSPSRSRKPVAGQGSSLPQSPAVPDLSHENSTIVNHLVIDDPQVDVSREQERVEESRPMNAPHDLTPITGLTVVGSEGVDDGGRGSSSTKTRQEKSSHPSGARHKETRFGEYILGQTLGEGEFGKVKMGWKREGGVQVAIKLIRRETLGSNPSRLPKIYREIAILRGLQHPNIVKLHEMVETERHIGIILEYASGGELFDYILQHRFLKDNAARRLFAQLISGVGYLHKAGIVHRDLKLENLLLDRNRNIIITDFGFANTFNPGDELGEEIEYNLGNRDYVKKSGLDIVRDDGHRRGDLMQTSCGSPCYAAPELVVSDCLYTGRKVDVWSCGVILYAMLAGYLPFDDDPANPEGDNINLLYKYIVSTPLTFPEYVTPHARDLLKRILVPDPRKRADLFEVARHSWLSEYAHVVGSITSSTTTSNDITNTTVASEDVFEPAHLARSASVREPTKVHTPAVAAIGGLVQKQGNIDDKAKTSRDAKRRTVQVEYVAPQQSTVRGDGGSTSPAAAAAAAQAKTRARSGSQGPVEVSMDGHQSQRQQTSNSPGAMLPPTRPSRDQQRAVSEYVNHTGMKMSYSARPSTGGSMSANSTLPSRGNSYGQPAVGIAKEQAQGRFSQPRGKQYTVSSRVGPMDGGQYPQTSSRPVSGIYIQDKTLPNRDSQQGKGHKRSSTFSELGGKLFGKRNSLFESKGSPKDAARPSRSRPPVSMTKPIPNEVAEPRMSTDSRRTSFSFGRKHNTSSKDRDPSASQRSSRRFSFLPSGLVNSLGGNRNSQHYPQESSDSLEQDLPTRSRADSRSRMGFGRRESRSPSRSTTASKPPNMIDQQYDGTREGANEGDALGYVSPSNEKKRYSSVLPPVNQSYLSADNAHFASEAAEGGDYYRSVSNPAPRRADQYDEREYNPQYPDGFNSYERVDSVSHPRRDKSVLQKSHRKFPEGDEKDGRAKRVMDFFRNRGKARNGD